MDDKKPIHKGVYILPNLFTTASLFSGFICIVMAIEGKFETAAMAILVSALFDGLDGKVARLTHSCSEFGIQYDSLADLVAFGVGPGILVYQWHLHTYGRLGLLASFLLIACGALRLARFNVQTTRATSKKFFIGLPIPAAASFIATFVLFNQYLPADMAERIVPVACIVFAYLLSFLMVSTIRYYSFKDVEAFRTHPFRSAVIGILLFVLIASKPMFLGFIFFLAYLVSGPVYTFCFLLPRRKSLREPVKELS